MGRPLKDHRLRMSVDLRIPVTVGQKQRIMEALAEEPGGFAVWAREVLLRAAEERLAKAQQKQEAPR